MSKSQIRCNPTRISSVFRWMLSAQTSESEILLTRIALRCIAHRLQNGSPPEPANGISLQARGLAEVQSYLSEFVVAAAHAAAVIKYHRNSSAASTWPSSEERRIPGGCRSQIFTRKAP